MSKWDELRKILSGEKDKEHPQMSDRTGEIVLLVILLITSTLGVVGSYKLGGWWGLAVYWGIAGNLSYEMYKLRKSL